MLLEKLDDHRLKCFGMKQALRIGLGRSLLSRYRLLYPSRGSNWPGPEPSVAQMRTFSMSLKGDPLGGSLGRIALYRACGRPQHGCSTRELTQCAPNCR